MTAELFKQMREYMQAIPEGEQMPFRCPKCGETVHMPTLAFMDFGAPNVHAKCGYSGNDMKVAV